MHSSGIYVDWTDLHELFECITDFRRDYGHDPAAIYLTATDDGWHELESHLRNHAITREQTLFGIPVIRNT